MKDASMSLGIYFEIKDAELRHSEGAIKRRILDLGINKKPVRCPPENGRRTKWKPCAAW